MKSFAATTAALAALLPLVHGHGFVTSPQPRMPGPAMKAACGNQVEINQQSDNYGNIQGELQVAASQNDYNAAECDIWLCKGYKFDDNKDNVFSYKAGQTIDFGVAIHAPHTGVANVSVVDTASNSVIGQPLISWDVYASTATGVKPDETSFKVTLPTDLPSKCATAGNCVLQWYWYAQSIDQTYESCIDFTVGAGSASGSGSSSSGSTTSMPATAKTTTAAVQSSSASIQPLTTLATQARQGSTPTQAAGSNSGSSSSSNGAGTAASGIPTGSAQDTLDYVRAVFQYLAGN
ncbi:Lytic cellulose monooxygenase (C1-hydroxylating) [Penicillium ucsense]|uniref:Lytic cellulose monooxygenase (C1-hydroxylating) n=1 Tax=Penicillium ucsense TaxID=2839758 RepID=A0A8J8WKS6_9EURO|nr:Lytic cellulose monooxygenase (C1-hydroxylating) [Penicillium ucsense]KAF7737323.1 Lytic cellulose monooxygenase (C1-hydroxylating) [Penicillium ucsense]